MMNSYYTVEQISNILDIHPKTIQRYIREGKLRATKVGKSWRVSGHDLSIFVEGNSAENPGSKNLGVRSVIASSVIDISGVDKENAMRIMNALSGALSAKPPEYGQSSVQSQYIEYESMFRITLWGDIRFMSVMMDMIASLTEQNNEE